MKKYENIKDLSAGFQRISGAFVLGFTALFYVELVSIKLSFLLCEVILFNL
jgi:hypothetical protein